MKITTPREKTTSEVLAALEEKMSDTLKRLLAERPEFATTIDWLEKNGVKPTVVVNAVLSRLIERGRNLPKEERTRYIAKVLLGEFFARWAKKHRGRSVKEMWEDEVLEEHELRPFELAIMGIAEPGVFKKTIPRLARQKMVESCGGKLGTADDFAAFAMTSSRTLAHRFLQKFDPTVINAAAKSLRYLETMAVSHYLHTNVKEARDDIGLSRHMDKSARLRDRTKLAAKLVYLPSLLTQQERALLRREYGLTGSLSRRMRVKDVAPLFGFPTPNTLSRKLYRLRGWVKSQKEASTPEESTNEKVRY